MVESTRIIEKQKSIRNMSHLKLHGKLTEFAPLDFA
jgi:hypothetical protein